MYKIAKIHNVIKIIKIIDGEPHIPDTKKSKHIWTPTIIEPKRLRKFRELNDSELCKLVSG